MKGKETEIGRNVNIKIKIERRKKVNPLPRGFTDLQTDQLACPGSSPGCFRNVRKAHVHKRICSVHVGIGEHGRAKAGARSLVGKGVAQ